MTEYVYDEAGRLVQTLTETEPEWDEQERAWMLALAEFERDKVCPACGGLKSVCQSPDNDGRFHVGPPTRCHVTTAIEQASDTYRESRVPRALMFGASLSAPTTGLVA